LPIKGLRLREKKGRRRNYERRVLKKRQKRELSSPEDWITLRISERDRNWAIIPHKKEYTALDVGKKREISFRNGGKGET